MATFFTIGPVPQAAERQRTRMWARFKAGTDIRNQPGKTTALLPSPA